MKTYIRTALLAAALSSRLVAADPVTGSILVFDHGGILEGNVERVGERYRVRSGIGDTWVPATGVLGLVSDKDAAFQLLKQKAKLGDIKERVRLARWCQSQGLKQRAVEEAEAALALKPQDRSLKSFRDDMKAFAAFDARMPAAPPVSAPPQPVVQVKVDSEPVAIEVTPESMGLFVTKVQPILMNACARCHSGNYNGKFKLTQTRSNESSKTTQTNLAVAAALIDRQQPAASVLLTRAISVHGGSGVPPLKDRQTAAYRHMDEWVRLATGNPAAFTPPANLPPAIIADAQPLPPMATPTRPTGFASDPEVKPALLTTKPGDGPLPAMPKPPDGEPKESAKPTAGDPFDPAIFNQLNGPKKP